MGRARTSKAIAKRKRQDAHRKRVYGLEPEQYDEMYHIQGERCALCKVATGKSRALSVDHDHVTNRVRGLLCRPCNTKLGWVEWVSLWAIVDYLDHPPYDEIDHGR